MCCCLLFSINLDLRVELESGFYTALEAFLLASDRLRKSQSKKMYGIIDDFGNERIKLDFQDNRQQGKMARVCRLGMRLFIPSRQSMF